MFNQVRDGKQRLVSVDLVRALWRVTIPLFRFPLNWREIILKCNLWNMVCSNGDKNRRSRHSFQRLFFVFGCLILSSYKILCFYAYHSVGYDTSTFLSVFTKVFEESAASAFRPEVTCRKESQQGLWEFRNHLRNYRAFCPESKGKRFFHILGCHHSWFKTTLSPMQI
jgi:hypothetical protein